MTVAAFTTPDGVEVPAITTDQMREVDRIAIEEVGPNLLQMMENAGRNLALMAIDALGERWRTDPIVVLAGTGGNGGGGIAAARHLANRGADVTVVLTAASRLGDVPRVQLEVFRATSGTVAGPGSVVQLDPALRGAALEMIDWANAQQVPVVALDAPSGLDSTSGSAPGAVIRANTTMTLALPKMGLDAACVGDLWLADIGIPAEVYRRSGIDVPVGLFGSRYRVPLEPR